MSKQKTKADLVKEKVLEAKKNGTPLSSEDREEVTKNIETDLRNRLDEYAALCQGGKDKRPIHLTIGEFVQEVWGYAPQDLGHGEHTVSREFYKQLGIDPSKDTLQMLTALPEADGKRWLVPEILREAIRLGLRKKPIYQELVREEINVASPNIVMPYMNMSNSNVKILAEAETIPVGTISYSDKNIMLYTLGTGVNITYKVLMYCPIDLLSIMLEDVGIRIGNAMDKLMMDVLINGDQADGSEAAPVVGVENTTNGIAYTDIIEALLRMGMIGRTPTYMLSQLSTMKSVMLLPEFKSYPYGQALINLMGDMPMPQTLQRRAHGTIPANYMILVDIMRGLLKFNSMPLMIEREKVMANQVQAAYVTITTGFANINRDGRLIIRKDGVIGSYPYPDYMDAEAYQRNILL